jgi:hypothetical protein
MIKVKQLTIDDIEFTIKAIKNFWTPRQTMKGCEEEVIVAFEEAIEKAVKQDPLWGWCQVRVSGFPKGNNGPYTCESSLGGCSYKNEKDFIENSGYYQDMQQEILNNIQNAINWTVKDLVDSNFIECEMPADFGG